MNWSCMVMTMEEPMFMIHIIAATTAGTPSNYLHSIRVSDLMDNKLGYFFSLIAKNNLAFCFKNRILPWWYCWSGGLCYNTTMWVQPYKKNCKEDTWKRKILFFMLGQPFVGFFGHNKSKADEQTCVRSNTRKYISYRCNNNFIRSTEYRELKCM